MVVIVGGAVAYLARKLFGVGPKPKRKPASFVPLTDLRRDPHLEMHTRGG